MNFMNKLLVSHHIYEVILCLCHAELHGLFMLNIVLNNVHLGNLEG